MPPEDPRRIQILHGEDEFGIAEMVQGHLATMGDPTMADMNTVRLDGRSNTLGELENAVRTLPFLTEYRLVVFNHPLEQARTPTQQKQLLNVLETNPPTTVLVLAVDHILTDKRARSRKRIHWLEGWALKNPEKASLRAFPVPVGVELGRWIQRRAKRYEGQFTLQAANLLAQQVGPELRVLDQEIQKLLAYANYDRPVDGEDVQHLTPKTAGVSDFALVDAIRDRNGRQALQVLHRQLEDEDPILLFHRVVGQFRILLQVREVLELGGNEQDVIRGLKMHPYYAKVSIQHARRFSLEDLELIYHRLLEIDVAIKTGMMESELALDVLVTELTV